MQAALERTQGEIVSRINAAAQIGFRELGYEITFFEQGESGALPPDPEIVVAGGIASVWRALERLGCPRPAFPTYPDELRPFAGRRLWETTLGEVRRGAEAGVPPVFVKPFPEDLKLFTGRVVRHWRDLIVAAGLPDDLRVWCSEPVEFRAEYRAFVHRGEVVGCKHYAGSWRLCPDFTVLDRAVEAFTTAPVAYALDLGVTADGRTLLVEANDGYSLGHYGLEPLVYARLLADRWEELVRECGRPRTEDAR